MGRKKTNSDQLHGVLDMLVLRVLSDGPLPGMRSPRQLERLSSDILAVQEGSLYPALYAWNRAAGWRPSGPSRTRTPRRTSTTKRPRN
jgi:hypothetical protein